MDVKQQTLQPTPGRAQELCDSRGGRPALPSLISLMISVGVKQRLGEKEKERKQRSQGLCESRGSRLGLTVTNKPCGLGGHKATLNLNTKAQGSGAV